MRSPCKILPSGVSVILREVRIPTQEELKRAGTTTFLFTVGNNSGKNEPRQNARAAKATFE